MIPIIIAREHLVKAIQQINNNGVPARRRSHDYCLVYESYHYPPKYTIALAHKISTGRFLPSDRFSGGQESNIFLKSRGFEVVSCNCDGIFKVREQRRDINRSSSARSKSQKTHSERCPECKVRVRQLLERIYGTCIPNYRLGWPTQLSAYSATPIFDHLERVLRRLKEFRGHSNFVKSESIPPIDFFIPQPGFIVEFDESQHFTTPRKIALSLYPPNPLVGFPLDRWISLCEAHNAKDNDPPYRDEQRAWYDTLRDIVPILHGMQPTVRLYAGDRPWCSLDPHNNDDLDTFKAMLGATSRKAKNGGVYQPEPIKRKQDPENTWNTSSCTVVSVYTVTLQQPHDRHTNKQRFQLIDQLLPLISKEQYKPCVVLLPGGYLGSGIDRHEDLANILGILQNQVSAKIRDACTNTCVCLGVDGGDGRDQLAVAVTRDGIQAIGRKFHPAPGDDNLKRALDYIYPEAGYQRILSFGEKRWYLSVCYDIFGISQLKLKNPGVEIILNMAHQFWPHNSPVPAKGDNYFARLGFAGASKQWDCPVFGTAVFFGKLIPEQWPTGVLWKSGAKLPRQCRYKDNQLWPQEKFNITSEIAKVLIRRYDLY